MVRTIDALLKTNYRGEYSPEEMYKKMDVVTNGHDAFLVLIDNRGHDLRNTEYFMALSKGDKGDPGINGKSAYDLAVEYEGFNGTVKDFLNSLKGDKGDKGDPGQLNGLVNDIAIDKYPDANMLTAKSIYAISGTQKNLPKDNVMSSFMMVLASADGETVTQLWFDPVNVELYVRAKTADTWSDWRWVTLWN